MQYISFTVLYDNVLWQVIKENKSSTTITVNLALKARSLKGILTIFKDTTLESLPWARDTESDFNPKISNVKITIKGVANQHYSNGLRSYQTFTEARKFFASSTHKRNIQSGIVEKDLALSDVTLTNFLLSKFSLWLDFRASDDKYAHGSKRKLDKASGITFEIAKTAYPAGA